MKIYLIHYYYPGTDPWKNIMDLPEKEAFRVAAELAAMHPYSFTLNECEYLRKWFSEGEKLVLNLSDIPEEQVSFTIGDSCAQITNGMKPEVLTKEMLMKKIAECGNSVEAFLEASLGKFAYIEVQLWYRPMETS